MTDGRSDITDMLERMPIPPMSVHRALELAADINADLKELVAIIEQKLLVHLHWTPLTQIA
jgi:hypothetical protein